MRISFENWHGVLSLVLCWMHIVFITKAWWLYRIFSRCSRKLRERCCLWGYEVVFPMRMKLVAFAFDHILGIHTLYRNNTCVIRDILKIIKSKFLTRIKVSVSLKFENSIRKYIKCSSRFFSKPAHTKQNHFFII